VSSWASKVSIVWQCIWRFAVEWFCAAVNICEGLTAVQGGKGRVFCSAKDKAGEGEILMGYRLRHEGVPYWRWTGNMKESFIALKRRKNCKGMEICSNTAKSTVIQPNLQ
jgi:hypothetical protein